MRLLFLLICLLGMFNHPRALAQTVVDSLSQAVPLVATPLATFNAERTRLDQRGMAVLGSWAVTNLLVSGIATGQTDGSARYFHQMNSGWGAINLALAGASYLAARRAKRLPVTDRTGTVRHQLRTENLYLFNAGLDVAYLTTGLYLLEKSRNPTASGSTDRWRGYGQSLLLQGSVLLLFDAFQFAAHHRHGRGLFPLLGRINLGPGSFAVSIPLNERTRSDHSTRVSSE
ncbi:hypothetical protein I2I05_19455 [Hymenobacter sp. BT683]|uniref:DUF5683 domain-containing protein n=1 Tax=Hymenobacter jeongseonensis TaxID=2791027 RepID=A0ABS0IML9_9BACT|nr:hypothetical protein [Hymenobacter jeongseonensis]MBF9239578.1 hypothetical protein [Hymenobacter jeongseonensis]